MPQPKKVVQIKKKRDWLWRIRYTSFFQNIFNLLVIFIIYF